MQLRGNFDNNVGGGACTNTAACQLEPQLTYLPAVSYRNPVIPLHLFFCGFLCVNLRLIEVCKVFFIFLIFSLSHVLQ